MPTVALGSVRLHYEEQGAGTPILGIHDTPGSPALWEDAAQKLCRQGHFIHYDRRGFHHSPLPDGTTAIDLDDHVNDALGLLDALSARPAVVIGHGTGGLVALRLALRDPGAALGLALLEPAGFTFDPGELSGLGLPTLLVSGEDSPAPLRAVVERLAAALPDATAVVVPGGHLIDPAHPEVLAFVDRLTV